MYKGHFPQSQISVSCINEPLLKGHLSIQDTLRLSLQFPLDIGFTVYDYFLQTCLNFQNSMINSGQCKVVLRWHVREDYFLLWSQAMASYTEQNNKYYKLSFEKA